MDEPTPPAPVETPQPEMVEKEKYMRLAADFENFRRQQLQAASDMVKFASQSVIAEMLELADMVEAAVAHAPPEVQSQAAWFAGLQHVGKRFGDDMKKYGVERIQTVGTPFDPVTMEAVSTTPGGTSHEVQSEVQSGYRMHERVIRPARVILYE